MDVLNWMSGFGCLAGTVGWLGGIQMDGRCVYFVGFSRELIDRMEALYDRGVATDTMKVSLTDMWTYSDHYFDDSYEFIDSLKGRFEKLFCRVVRWYTLKQCKASRDEAEKFLRMA